MGKSHQPSSAGPCGPGATGGKSICQNPLVGCVTAVVVAVCVGVGMGSRSVPLDNGKLVVYMSQTQQDEYATFSSDLDLFEQEWF